MILENKITNFIDFIKREWFDYKDIVKDNASVNREFNNFLEGEKTADLHMKDGEIIRLTDIEWNSGWRTISGIMGHFLPKNDNEVLIHIQYVKAMIPVKEIKWISCPMDE